MKRTVSFALVLLALSCARADSFYNSAEFYALLGAKATASNLVDAIFSYETNGMDEKRAESMAALGVDGAKEYSELDKMQFVYRARELRRAYRKDVAKLRNESLKKLKLPDKMKLSDGKIKFNPPPFSLWAKSGLGTNAMQVVCEKNLDFDGFMDFLLKETGPDSIKPKSVLHRKIGSFAKLTKEEKIVWLFRAQMAMIMIEAENAKRQKRRFAMPIRNENGRPPVKPYRAANRN